jgi:hypothetical protein
MISRIVGRSDFAGLASGAYPLQLTGSELSVLQDWAEGNGLVRLGFPFRQAPSKAVYDAQSRCETPVRL